MVKINETIKTWAFFDKSIEPRLFFWRGRKIKIDKINLVHTSKNSASLFYHFSVSSGGNFYRLKFDVEKMKWFLEEVDDSSY
ncbi:hypothetical protein HYU96_00680 [Candidatus Daviesbacteria bacterium]|nr:hypothetical protein [Candidatus Daviesbacteria bacterium]